MEDSAGLGRRTFLRVSGLAGMAGIPGVASATPGREPGRKSNEWIVGVSTSTDSPRTAVDARLPSEASVVHENNTLGYAAIELSEQVSTQACKSLLQATEESGPIKYLEKNRACHAQFLPDDPKYDSQYADQQINASTAWEETLGDAGVTVAIVDQGIKYDHPDLEDNIADNPGRDFIDDDEEPYPEDLSTEPHGTHVSGIAAAGVDNGVGVSGIGNSTLLSVRALNEDGRGALSDIADAIEWATDQGADVINLSLGGGGYSETIENALSYATANGALVIAASGNQGNSEVNYPGAYDNCMAVSALNPDGSLARYSNVGSDIELAAPGTNVISTWIDDGYRALSGTSMASPVVAGVAGLTLAQWDLTDEELRTHLKNTAVDVGLSDTQQGAGRVDAGRAVTTRPGDNSNNHGSGSSGSDSPDSEDQNNRDTDSPDTAESIVSEVEGSLQGSQNENYYSYEWGYETPSKIVLTLKGPPNADLDIYAAEGVNTLPSPSGYDYSSRSSNSYERITIDDPDESTKLYVAVDAYSGNGRYTLTFTEYA